MSVKKEKEERSYALKLEGTDEAVKLDKDHQVLLDSMISDKANAIKLFEDHLQKGVEDICQPLTVILELADLDHVDLLKKAFKILYLHDKNDQKRQLLITTMLLLIDEKGTKNQLIRYINSFIQDYPKWDHLYIQRAQYYDDSGKFEKAINDFNMAIKLNPVKTETYGLRADTYTKMKKFNKALEDYDILVSERPTANSYYRRFCCYCEKGFTEGYLTPTEEQIRYSDIDNAYKIDKNPALLYFRGDLKKMSGNPEGAISDFELFLGDARIQEKFKDSFFASAYGGKAECHLDIGELDDAKLAINRAFDIDDSVSSNYFLRSKLFYQNYEDKFNECKELLDPVEGEKKRISKKKISALRDEIKEFLRLARKDVDTVIELTQNDDNEYYIISCLKHRKKIIEANVDPLKKYKDLSVKEIKQIEQDLSFIVEHGEYTDDYLDDLVDIVRFYETDHKRMLIRENEKFANEITQLYSQDNVVLIEENKLLKKKIEELEDRFDLQTGKKIEELEDQLHRDHIKSVELLDKRKKEVADEILQRLTHRLKNEFGVFAIKLNNFVNIIEQKFNKSLSDLSREPIAGEDQGDIPTINDKIIAIKEEWKYIDKLIKQAKDYHNLTLSPKLVDKLDAKSKKILKQPSKSNLRIHIDPNKKLSNVKVSIDIDQWKELLIETLNNAKKHNPNKNIDLYFNFNIEDNSLLIIDYYNNGADGKADFLPYELGKTRFGLSFIKKIIDMHGFKIIPREKDNKFGFKINMPIMNEGTR